MSGSGLLQRKLMIELAVLMPRTAQHSGRDNLARPGLTPAEYTFPPTPRGM
jgi:hypothetical protein